jgi:hypothetical protein
VKKTPNFYDRPAIRQAIVKEKAPQKFSASLAPPPPTNA